MVSPAAAVCAKRKFTGIVGTDILLSYLDDLLQAVTARPGLNRRRGRCGAGRHGRLAAIRRVLVAPGRSDRLSLGVTLAATINLSAIPHELAGFEPASRPIGTAPWRLSVAASDSELRGLVPVQLWPYAILFGGLLLTLLAAQQLLGRMLVGPALALVQRVHARSLGEVGRAITVPDVWRLWFAASDKVFGSGRAHLAKTQAQRALKAAMIEAALDCIITIDEAGCVLEFNRGTELTLGYTRADVLGRNLADPIVPRHLRAAHDGGMRRYLRTGEPHGLGRRIEVEAGDRHGRLLPVELASAA